MPDALTIGGAISGLKVAADIAKSFLDLKSIADVQGKVIELQSVILSAQSSALAAQAEQSAMVQRVSDLEKEIAQMKAWEETKKRYRLVNAIDGIFFYAQEEQGEPPEPMHWICAKCYEDGRKSILQISGEGSKTAIMCFHCKSRVVANAAMSWFQANVLNKKPA